MSDLKVRRWAGSFGIAGFVVFLAALPLYFISPQPTSRLGDSVQFSDSVSKASAFILTRATLADPLIMACLVVFLAGFRHVIRRARPDAEWIATLVFGAGLVVVTLELAGDALQGAAALDTSVKADPIAVRALWEGSFVFYGAIGIMMSALFLATAGVAVTASRVLPTWIGWAAFAAAAINLAAVPSIFGGTDYTRFYTASGYVTSLAQAALLLWFLVASISLIVTKGEATVPVHPAFKLE